MDKERTIELQDMVQMAKDMLCEQKDLYLTFFIDGDDMQIIGVPELDREKIMDALKTYVAENNAIRYFSMMTAYAVSKGEIAAAMKRRIEKGGLHKQMNKDIAELMQSPANNPLRQEVLVVAKYEKGVGTDTEVIPFNRDGDKIIWKDPWEGGATEYARFNIWTPYQVTANEGDTT